MGLRAGLLISMLLLASVGVWAQSPAPTPLSLAPAPLLPETIGAWKRAGAVTAEPDARLAGSSAEMKEYGLKRSETAEYADAKGKATLSAMEMQDSTGAFSAFTLMRPPGMRPCAARETIGTNCAAGGGRILFWAGDTVVSATGDVTGSSLRDLLQSLPKPGGAKGATPLLPGTLPKDGLDAESVRYAVGPATYARLDVPVPAEVIDFAKSPEMITAKYGGERLTVIFYPTPTIAGDRMRAIESAEKDVKGFVVGRSGPLVSFATGSLKDEQAKALVDKVRYNATVSWNHPEGYISEVSKTASVMVKILAFVFVMTLAALVLGVFFGGARALIRKARGKPLSSLADDDVIKLDLRGPATTPIQPYEK